MMVSLWKKEKEEFIFPHVKSLIANTVFYFLILIGYVQACQALFKCFVNMLIVVSLVSTSSVAESFLYIFMYV